MKFSVKTPDLQQAVAQTIRATNKTSPLAVLKCIVFTANNNVVTLQATNLELGVLVEIQGSIARAGVVAIPGETIKQFIDALIDVPVVVFEEQEGSVVVTGGAYTARFAGLPYEDFPNIPETEGETIKIDAEKFFTGIRSVWYAAAQASMKPELSSVFVNPKQDGLVYAATDSFRLAEKTVQYEKLKKFTPVLIPIKNATELIRIFDGVRGGIEVVISQNQLLCVSGGVRATTRIIDGTFPDYEQIIPKTTTTEIVVLKQDLIQALKVSHVLANAFHQVRIMVDDAGDAFTIQTQTSGVGDSTTKVQAKITGETIDMSFNYRYITDSFQSIPSDSLLLQFSGAGKPLIIRGVGDQTFRYLTMPMNR